MAGTDKATMTVVGVACVVCCLPLIVAAGPVVVAGGAVAAAATGAAHLTRRAKRRRANSRSPTVRRFSTPTFEGSTSVVVVFAAEGLDALADKEHDDREPGHRVGPPQPE